MTLKRLRGAAGELLILEHESRVLADNPLGDPHVRRLPVWLPPGWHRDRGGRRFPVLYALAGYTGSGWSLTNWRNFEENLPERLARLVHEERMAPAVVVFPDCFTALGGNQYVNSSAIGRYADYLTRELIPFVDRELGTGGDRRHRGCFGKSSGGYGALIHGMRYARYWGAVASHAGDAGFELVYGAAWPEALTTLAAHRPRGRREGPVKMPAATPELDQGLDDGRVRRFLRHMDANSRPGSAEIMALMMVCMAATYDPDPDAPNGFRLPVHLDTGERLPARWRAWKRHDPVNLVKRHAEALKSLRGIYLDCGWNDQFHIQYGSRILSRALHGAGVKHVYEEFEGSHSGIDHRLDRSLPFLTRALR